MNEAFIAIAEKSDRNHTFSIIGELILRQDTKPDQATINEAFIIFAKKDNEEMVKLLLRQDMKPDPESIKKAFDVSVEKNSSAAFARLAKKVAPEDIQSAFMSAAQNGSISVLKEILKKFPQSESSLSEALIATANKFIEIRDTSPKTRSEKSERINLIDKLVGCCKLISTNKAPAPNEESRTYAKTKQCN